MSGVDTNSGKANKMLQWFFEKAAGDNRLGPAHIALFMALLNLWVYEREIEKFKIARVLVMQMAKICSPTTYYKTMQELSEWGYLLYIKANNKWEEGSVLFGAITMVNDHE